jgi:uncharacterized membrane protein
MWAAFSAWLASQGASLLLGALSRLLLDAWRSYRADVARRDLAAVRTQLAQAQTTIAAQQAQLQAQADAPRTAGDAIERLEEGSA